MTGPIALTIAGSDAGGGAGVVADVRTFVACGVWPTVAITAITAQNTTGVDRLDLVDPAMVIAQISAVTRDMEVKAVKTGMLGAAAVVMAVADALSTTSAPLVVDPVLLSTSGTRLLDETGVAVLRRRLLPRAALVTPNLAEAAALTGRTVATRADMEVAGRELVGLGCDAALVTGGHLEGETVADCLVVGAGAPRWFESPRLGGPGSHGSGCVLSAAVAAHLALGEDVVASCTAAIAFSRAAITAAVRLGAGPGAVNPG